MPRLAANLTMLFGDDPLGERLARAAAAGFRGVEILFPYAWPARDVSRQIDDSGLAIALINAPPGDWDAGERGLAALPGREKDFRRSFRTALSYADALSCPRIHVMAGIAPGDAGVEALDAAYAANLAHAADEAARAGVQVTIEPLNDRDVPGYHLSRTAHARRIIERVGADNLGLQFDFYHAQVMEGDITRTFRGLAPLVSHVQIAGVPDRHEPDTGELDCGHLLRLLGEAGYDGWVGCEYRPRGRFEDGLAWAGPWGLRPSGREDSAQDMGG